MKNTQKFYYIMLIVGYFLCFDAESALFGDPALTTVGVGTRAFALGNNFTALSNDLSATFWNPAGLGFVSIREFSFSLSGFSNAVETSFDSSVTVLDGQSEKYRIKIGNIGILRSIPTKQGGFAFAIAYQTPYILDMVKSYHILSSNRDEQYSYSSYGQLNMVTSSFGVQIAPNLSVGASLSFLTGKGSENFKYRLLTNGYLLNIESDTVVNTNSRNYLGYDVRLGLMYSLNRFSVGMRVVFPQIIHFNEINTDFYYDDSLGVLYSGTDNFEGELERSSTGAVGVSAKLPFMLITGDLTAQMPSPEALDNTTLSWWKIGGGGGVEIPLFIKTFLFRFGYHYDDYNKYPFVVNYEISIDSDISGGENIIHNENLFTVGFSYLVENSIAFEVSYGYRFWEIYPRQSYSERHDSHRLLASIIIHY